MSVDVRVLRRSLGPRVLSEGRRGTSTRGLVAAIEKTDRAAVGRDPTPT
jgi:hypothetical protein